MVILTEVLQFSSAFTSKCGDNIWNYDITQVAHYHWTSASNRTAGHIFLSSFTERQKKKDCKQQRLNSWGKLLVLHFGTTKEMKEF
jgi:hypothetical protein